MPKLRLALTCAAVLAAALPSAASAKTVTGYRFKVVKATHTSSASETNGSFYHYTGTTSESWKLRGKSKDVANAGDVFFGVGGIVQLNVNGVYRDDVHTTFGDSNDSTCSLTAPTGSSDYPAVAPESVSVNFIQKSRNGSVQVGWNFPMASLQNAYFGTECSHPDAEFPDDKYFLDRISAKTLRKKKFTLVNSGTPGGKYGNYTWRTTVTLQRVKTYK